MHTEIRSLLRTVAPFRRVNELIAAGTARVSLDGAVASTLSFVVADVVEENDRPVLLVLPRPEDAEQYADELEGMLDRDRVSLFPSWELLPYEEHSPTIDLTAARMRALGRLVRQERGVIVTSARALVPRILPRRVFRDATISIVIGDELDLDAVCERLIHIGFQRSPLADEPGVFARRGGILDIYSSEWRRPVRMELFGDEVESIREFDPESQRSSQELIEVLVLPQQEIPITDEVLRRMHDLPLTGEVADMLTRGTHFDGIERWLPHFFADADTLFDYLPDNTVVAILEEKDIYQGAAEIWEEAVQFHGNSDEEDQLPTPDSQFLDPAGLEKCMERFDRIVAKRARTSEADSVVSLEASPAPPFLGNLDLLKSEFDDLLARDFRIFVLCDNTGQLERLGEVLDAYADRVALGLGKLRRGFLLPAERVALFAEHEIFRRVRRPRLDRRRPRGAAIDSYLSLKPGDYVVHVHHGVGRFQEVRRIDVDGSSRDCVVLGYSGDDRLFVPTDQMDLLQKYTGSDSVKPSVDRIGGTAWAKTKTRAEKAVREMAEELIRLYAARLSRPGHAFPSDTHWQQELESSFLYEETDHQLRAMRDVKGDMETARPMDRLICGDVGYGKTEVAIRAAFKAIMDTKQVAILVPTTILAQQHYRTFKDRFGAFPIRVEVLSRFRNPAETKQVIADLAEGKVDVLIGTHRILSKDIRFKDLGLLVIDEEQRFGVRQKEKLKRIRETVDVLTLTATPIPRTLHMSLAGARDMSLINTPPKNRLPIVTEVIDFDGKVIVAAILRELDRGGQVFFVHNRVQSITSMASYLSKLVPEARIGIAHGQMTGRKLEAAMLAFTDRKVDILVSTMIIESGLDIPTVNTLLVNRADHFGLAQLYQLRGRVGRSNHRAYTYLIVPRSKKLTEVAQKRLEALTEFTDLGSGFRIARKDLEIRGAGNLLGARQHGFVASVGFEMYCKLLEDAVSELKGETPPAGPETRIESGLNAYLADDYVGDSDLKVVLYRRLARSRDSAEVGSIREEVADRFGRLPDEAANLFSLRELKILGEECGAESVRLDNRKVRIRAGAGLRPSKKKLEALIEGLGAPVSFDATTGLIVEIELDGSQDPVEIARKVLLALV